MQVKSLLLALLTLVPFGVLHPQTPSYYHYSTTDGLASSTVFNIIQGRDGFIWFATLNGMSRFDGKHFTTYRTTDGLNSNTITALAEGNRGELYIGNYEKGVNVLQNGRIENYCDNIHGKSLAISYLMVVPAGKDEQKLYAYRSYGNINTFINKKQGGVISDIFNTSPIHINRLKLFPGGMILALTANGLFNLRNNNPEKLNIEGFPDTDVYCISTGDSDSYLLGTKGMIYRIKNNRVIEKIRINLAGNNDVSCILSDKNHNIWFSIMNKGFYLIPAESGNIIDIGSKLGLQNSLVNDYMEDVEGNIWVSTYGKGVYCLNNLYLQSYNENDGMSNNNVYSVVEGGPGRLVTGTFNGINILENGTFYQVKSKSLKTLTDYIYSIKNINNEFYICGATGASEIENISFRGLRMHIIDRPSFCKTRNGLYLLGSGGNFILVQNTIENSKAPPVMFHIFGDSSSINRVNEIFEDSEDNVWIGTTLGLCKITHANAPLKEWEKTFFPSDPVLGSRINAIFQDRKNNVWFAGEKGIGQYQPGNKMLKTYTAVNGYDLSSSTSVAMDNKDRVWIGSMKGLFLLDGNAVKYLNRQTGLPSDEVLSLCFDVVKNVLCIGTSNGISFLDMKLFDDYHPSPPDVRIISIKAGSKVYTDYKNLVFEPEQRDVSIELKALNFSSPGSVKFEYKLNNGWIATDYDFLNFLSLKNGTYNLQIRARAQNTGWSKPFLLTFRVRPQFFETIWFDLLLITIFMVTTLLVVIWRVRTNNNKVRKELELTERINDLKHKALSAMMNPHFISNSLNSVQYLVNSQKYEEANDYIAMMAKLMRKNLDTAGSGFILLSEEINRLKLYLDLEKLRFRESFSYELITGTDVDSGCIMIPNMIIQPFVENSLWHGIINSGNRGLLTVSFAFEDVFIDNTRCRSLIIKVTDNGIGIDEARKNKKEDHISKGIQIIEERLNLLSVKMHLPRPIMFEDLGSQDNNSQGTEVIISLPPPLYKLIIQEQGNIFPFTV